MVKNGLISNPRWLSTPHREDFMFPFEQQFNSLFDHFFENSSIADGIKASSGYPKMDIISNDDSLVVRAAMPGLDTEDISVELSESVLKISGKKIEKNEGSNAQYITKELRSSQFTRIINLPEWVKEDPIATMKNGILTLKWDKPKEVVKKPEQRLIEIKKE